MITDFTVTACDGRCVLPALLPYPRVLLACPGRAAQLMNGAGDANRALSGVTLWLLCFNRSVTSQIISTKVSRRRVLDPYLTKGRHGTGILGRG